jgi:hypothetical protein
VIGFLQQLENPDDLTVGEAAMGIMADAVSNRAPIFKRLWSLGVDSKEWISPAYVAWRAGTITLFLLGS